MSKAKSAAPVAKQYVTRREVATYLGCSLGNIKELVRKGLIPEFDLSPYVKRYRLEDVEAFVESRRKHFKSPRRP